MDSFFGSFKTKCWVDHCTDGGLNTEPKHISYAHGCEKGTAALKNYWDVEKNAWWQ